MNGFKRRKPEPVSSETQPAEVQLPTEIELHAHVDRSLIMLTTKLQKVMERIDVVEYRLDELNDHLMNTPSHSDVLEVRMHGAKLAAELARTTVELRGEIGMAGDEARRAARMARTSMESQQVNDEQTINLIEVEKKDPFSAAG